MVVHEGKGVAAGRTEIYQGTVNLPVGGWVAARAYASEPLADAWPTMAKRSFAHSSPVWISKVGSVDPTAQAAAAADLLRAIDAAEQRARAAYGEVETPKMQARFDAARVRLSSLTGSGK